MTSRKKILLGCLAMVLAMIGDYLLGFGTFSTSSSPDAYMGITANVVPDWRYALSSILGFLCAPIFAVAALELMKVMETKYALGFAFIHIGICMLPVVFNAGMDATGDLRVSVDMVIRVAKSVAVPMGLGFIICDCFAMIAWVGIVLKGMLPVNKIALICNPVFIALLGQLMNYVAEGLDSGFESLGWLLMYLVCAMSLVGKEERV